MKFNLKALSVALIALGLTVAAASQQAVAGEYPERAITMICTHGPGDTDFNTRLISRLLEKELGVPVVVNTVQGANASIAYNQFKDHKPADGYLFIGTNTMSLAADEASGLTDFGYDAFEPVAIYGRQCGENMIVSANFPYKTVEELAKASQEKPESIKMGIAMGGSSYIAALIMEQDLNTKFAIVDAGGNGSDRVTQLIGGHIDITIAPYTLAKEYIEAGKVRPLFTMLSQKLAMVPEIPAACEAGVPNLKMDSMYAILAPKGTPADIVEKVNAAILKIVNTSEDYKENIRKMNYQEPWALNVQDTIAKLKEQREHIMSYSKYLQ